MAVDVAMVASAADHDLAVTAGAIVKTGGVSHRLLLPMRTNWIERPERGDTVLGPCHARAGGAAAGMGLLVRTAVAPVSTALTV